LLVLSACTTRTIPLRDAGMDGEDASFDGGVPERDAGRPRDAGPPPDARLVPDAACASSTSTATIERLPVDIIWMIDSSSSMRQEIERVQEGMNDFAALIESRDLDYRVILLSLRADPCASDADCDSDGETCSLPNGVCVARVCSPSCGAGFTCTDGFCRSNRHPVCIPSPLAGDTQCGDGPRFFHVELDILSTQPIEQLLGTLAQSPGYAEGESRGSAPWRDLLRPDATKTIVVVTDDNARTCALPGTGRCAAGDPPITSTSLEDFPGGPNPFNGETLGPGILTDTYGSLFEGYKFSAIYGWGSETDPSVRCSYSDGQPQPDSSGPTYTELVRRTDGVRAQICADASEWTAFFTDVASAVERGTRIECNIAIPAAPEGFFFDRDLINVFVDVGEGAERIGFSQDEAGCTATGGWYYDDPEEPTEVILCPATCDRVQESSGTVRNVDVQFGCETIPI
jgi:hypothetical protein